MYKKFKEAFLEAEVVKNRQLIRTIKQYNESKFSIEQLNEAEMKLQALLQANKQNKSKIKNNHIKQIKAKEKSIIKKKEIKKIEALLQHPSIRLKYLFMKNKR